MPRPDRYLVTFFFTVSILTTSYNVASLWLDPFGVVWPQQIKPLGLWEDGRRHLVVEHLRTRHHEYEGFVVANSRGFFLSADVATELTGISFYNTSFSADTIYGYADLIAWLLKAEKPKHFVILLSFDQFSMGDSRKLALLTREHPEVSGETWLRYYFAFSNDMPGAIIHRNLADALHLGHRLFGPIFPAFGQYNSPYGPLISICCNTDIWTGDIRGWGAVQPSTQTNVGPWGAPPNPATRDAEFGEGPRAREVDATLRQYWASPFDQGALAKFKQMMALLRNAEVKTSCLVPPISARGLKFVDTERYASWLAVLVRECGSVWDFSDRNSITSNKENYLDWSHFLAPVGKLMFQRIFGSRPAELAQYPDFGNFVDARNLSDWALHWRTSFQAVTPQPPR